MDIRRILPACVVLLTVTISLPIRADETVESVRRYHRASVEAIRTFYCKTTVAYSPQNSHRR
jgi:hypothetical protein